MDYILKYQRKDMSIFSTIFFLLLICYFFLMHTYTKNAAINYTDTIKNEINLLIKSKQTDTFILAKNFAHDKKLIATLENKQYEKMYDDGFFTIPKSYFKYKNIKIHVVDKDGIQRYLSWTHKDLGNNILAARKDLRYLYKHPYPLSNISVGRFSIGLKGIVPIYNKKHEFLGIIETITFFNSISKKLMKDNIHSAIIIKKRYTKQLSYSFSKIFINGYNVSNKDINPEILQILKSEKISHFLELREYQYIFKEDSIFNGYYLINIPILNHNKKVIGNYLAFIDDIYHLRQKEFSLYLLFAMMSMLFILMSFIALKAHINNLRLIENLDYEVQKQTNEKLKLLYIDGQTGAYKKIKFDEDIKNHQDDRVVILNIKNFAKINTSYSFENGDKILKISAKRIQSILNKPIYRLNSDEFLFFSRKPKDEIKLLKQSFSKQPIKLEHNDISIRISFTFGVAKANIDKLVSKLSTTVKEAKKYPFSDFLYYRDKVVDNSFIHFNSILYEAIFENHENISIVPFFQGIRNNNSKKIVKYEILARLKVDDHLYLPIDFLDAAKSSGFIHEITKIMVEKSCTFLSTCEKHIEVSINITEDDLASKQLKEVLTSTLKRYKIDSTRITLEVLEGVTATGTKNNIKQLRKLKELGYKLAIDDFGVEYSNFERLNEIDMDFIKIDGKYIRTLENNPKSLKITKAITDFAHSMGIKVVAEFVENKEIQDIVESLGIEYSQGYYFAKPQEVIKVE